MEPRAPMHSKYGLVLLNSTDLSHTAYYKTNLKKDSRIYVGMGSSDNVAALIHYHGPLLD